MELSAQEEVPSIVGIGIWKVLMWYWSIHRRIQLTLRVIFKHAQYTFFIARNYRKFTIGKEELCARDTYLFRVLREQDTFLFDLVAICKESRGGQTKSTMKKITPKKTETRVTA